MIARLLSGDTPRSSLLTALLLIVLVSLAFAPFLFPGTKSLETAARISIFIVLVASYDLLLGYAGVVSFAHTMFFGIGAYGTALALSATGPTYWSLIWGTAAGAVVAAVFALAIGLFSLRVKAIFFAMVTLAVASQGPEDRHACGRQRLRGSGLADVLADRRRGRPQLQDPARTDPGLQAGQG